MLSFIPQGRFLPGRVIVEKLISLKHSMPENISQHCLGANSYIGRGKTRYRGRLGIFLNLIYAALVNLIVPIMKKNC